MTRFVPAVFIFACLWAQGVLGASPPGPDTIPLREISRGMTGYGLTVFEGSRIDTFAVTVVGVQTGARAAGNLILVEVAGHDLARSNVAQGMSGSPVYLDGRLAGAVAMGWGGALRPLAGVTPIEEMLTLPADQRHTLPEARGLAGRTGMPENLMQELLTDRVDERLASEILGSTDDPGATTRPALGGWPSPENLILDLLGPLLPAGADTRGMQPENWVISPLSGGDLVADGNSPLPPATLAGGSACAIPLIMGDAMLGAIGTVTWVQDDQVYMMGHPFMQRGPVNLPLATAEILTVFPSRQISFKLGSIGQVVGSVHHDLRAGLSGRLGPAPEMIPVEVALNVQGSPWNEAKERRYHFEVVDDRQLTPTLVFWALYNSLLAESDDASRQNVQYAVTLQLERSDTQEETLLTLEGYTAGAGGVGRLASDIMAPLSMLLNNPFEPVRLKQVAGDLHTERPAVVTEVRGITLDQAQVAAGQTLQCRVEVAPSLGPLQDLKLTLALPGDLKPGPYRLAVASAAEMFALEAQRAPVLFQPRNLDGLLDLLQTERSAGTLVVALFAPGTGVMVQGLELDRLPGRVARVLRSGDMQVGTTLADLIASRELDLDGVIQGHAIRSITVNPAAQPAVQERRP